MNSSHRIVMFILGSEFADEAIAELPKRTRTGGNCEKSEKSEKSDRADWSAKND
jgi:hypothetical protein